MNDEKQIINRGRHAKFCKICNHPQREEIEEDYVSWLGPAKIKDKYGLADVSTIYRHARATGLADKRDRNIKAALSRIIEKAGDVVPNSAAIVQACIAYAKINSEGRFVDRTERIDLNKLFAECSTAELEKYCATGELPLWFQQTVGPAERE